MGKLQDAAFETRVRAEIEEGMRQRAMLKERLPHEMYLACISDAKVCISEICDDMNLAPLTAALVCLDDTAAIPTGTTDDELKHIKAFIRIALVEMLETEKDKAALPAGM